MCYVSNFSSHKNAPTGSFYIGKKIQGMVKLADKASHSSTLLCFLHLQVEMTGPYYEEMNVPKHGSCNLVRYDFHCEANIIYLL